MSKSRRGKSASTNEISKWETELIQIPLSEESWKSCVFFVLPNKVEDNVFIDILSDVVGTGLRKLYSVITFDGLMKDVKEYGKGATTGGGKGKGAAAAKPPPFHEICEQVKLQMEQGEAIPASMMAKLLKFKLLHVKQKDFERREEERKAAKAAESGKKDEKGKKSGSPSGKRSKSPGKKRGKKEADLPPSPKKDTKMRRRGDIEDTFKTIDDEPDDEGSPQHYVLIHGILTSPVIYHLCEIGINVDAIISIKAQNYDRFLSTSEPCTEGELGKEELDPEVLEGEIQDSEAQAQKCEAERQLSAFWSESDSLVARMPSGHKLKDIARYEVVVRDKDVPDGNIQELEEDRKTEFGTVIFEDVAVVCYDMLDQLQQYKKYLDHMKLVQVPLHNPQPGAVAMAIPSATDVPSTQSLTTAQAPDGPPAPVPVEVDMRYYNHLMNSISPQSQSVALIMNCLLEQVTATVDEKNPLDQEVPPRADGLNHLLASHIGNKASRLALSDEERKTVDELRDKNNSIRQETTPIILHHGDEMTSRLHHVTPVNGLDALDAELRMLQLLPQSQLKNLPELKGRELIERAARANEMQHFCLSESVPARGLERALKQYAFEGMLLKLVDEHGEIMAPPDLDEAFETYVNPWDYPYNDLGKFQNFDESGQRSDDESVFTTFRNLDEWCFAEHFDQKTLVQILEQARFSRPYMDTCYHKRDHTLLLALHNPVGPRAQSSSSWQSKLHSNVGFRNYLEHVVDSISDWVQEEERLRREATRTPTPPPPVLELPTIPLKVGSRYGLMTRAEVTAIKAEEEEKSKKGKGRKSARSRTPKRSAKSRDKSESPEKKDKEKKREGSAVSRQKSAGRRTPSAKGSLSVRSAASKGGRGMRSRSEPEEPESLCVEEPVEEDYDFIGYDVGDNLIHASGSLRTMFPCDGGQIRVDETSYVQGPRSVRASVYKDGNIFVLHFLEPLNEILKEEDIEREEGGEEKEKDAEQGEQCKVVETDGDAEGIEKSEMEENEKDDKGVKPKRRGPKPFCDFSSFTAQLNDGMIISLSGYGPSGSIRQTQPKEGEELILGQGVVEGSPPTQATPSPQPKAGSPKSRKRTDEEARRLEELQQQHEEEQVRQEEEAKRKAEEERLRKPFQQFFLTCPDGLHVEYLNNGSYQSSKNQGGVLVRQSYPVKASGPWECDVTRLSPAMDETSRTVMTDGTVIKLHLDGSIQVLFPDGAVTRCQTFPSKSHQPSSAPGSAVAKAPGQDPTGGLTRKGTRAAAKGDEPVMPTINLPDKVPEWLSTGVDGERLVTRSDGRHETLSNILCSIASDPQTGQVVKTREDNVVTVERPDGTQIVEHADGTRITTLYKQVEREIQPADNETGEQAQVSSVLAKFVKVECAGFATLVFDSDSGSCESAFGNGTVITTQANGASLMKRPDESMVQIDAKGVVCYIPRSIACTDDLEPAVGEVAVPACVYVMRSASQQCCEMTDSRGTHFSVISNGQMCVEQDGNATEKNKNGSPNTAAEPTNTVEQTTTPGPLTQAPLTSLVPRFFIVHANGSGTELLRPCDVTDYLAQAEKDPGTAVLRSPVEGHPHATGVTILRPYSGGTDKLWLKEKDEEIIVPVGLRERDFSNVPSREAKKTGPVFGTNVGSGLNVGSVFRPSLSQPLVTCPRVLEFRQLIQYKPLTSIQRQQLFRAMEAYGKYVAEREGASDALLPEDPREESQKLAAEELRAKMKDREEVLNKSAVDTNALQSDKISQTYLEAITPEPVPPPPAPTWKRPVSEWERDRVELAELEYGKHSLRHHGVPAYFETTQGQNFLQSIYSKRVPDMNTLTAELARNTRHPPLGDGSPAPEVTVQRDSSMSEGGDVKEEQNNTTPNDTLSPTAHASSESPNDVRPTNPTPRHATGDGTPTPVRPTNPTPAHASKEVPANPRPTIPTPNPTPNPNASENEPNECPSYEEASGWRSNLPSVQEVVLVKAPLEEPVTEPVFTPVEPVDPDDGLLFFSDEDEKVGARSLYFDVTGDLRKEQVKLPVSILSSKPGALLNTQFMEVEDPVRRLVNTVSVAGGDPVSRSRVANLRGFELLPPKVSFGVLKEGCTYIHSVLLKNVGIDGCRFKVKQPPPSTGLCVLYTPGPVAAGMSTCLDVEIFAVAVGVVGESGLGHVGHHVEIVTETEILYLPVNATVMTSYEYEKRYGDEDGGISTNTRRVPNRPPSRDPTRPRKEEHYALLDNSN